MLNLKYILAAGTALLIPNSVFADTCASLPSCESLGFEFSASDCGTLKKLKCPFANDKFFCSKANCKAVNYNSKEHRCTKWCAEDSKVCEAVEDLPCSTIIRNYGGTAIAEGTTNNNYSATQSWTGNVYLMGAVTISYLKLVTTSNSGISIHDASQFETCKTEMAGKKASLTVSYLTVDGYSANFYVPTIIKQVEKRANGGKLNSLYFNKDAKVYVQYVPDRTYGSSLEIFFSGDEDKHLKGDVIVGCVANSSSQWNVNKCNVTINGYGADIVGCAFVNNDSSYSGGCYDGSSSSGTCYGSTENISCDIDSYYGSCKFYTDQNNSYDSGNPYYGNCSNYSSYNWKW